jgi:peptidoglycan/LPS O-acetylase OafA/YrhL
LKTYHLPEDAFESAQRRNLPLVLFVVGATVAIVIALALRGIDQNDSGWFALVVPAIMLPFLVFGFARGLRKSKALQRDQWMTYELLLGNNSVTRRMKGVPDLMLSRNDITVAREHPTGLTVGNKAKRQYIFINQSLVGFDEVRAQIAEWKPISPPGWTSHYPAIRAVVFALFILAMLVFFTSRKSWLSLVTGIPLVLVLIWVLIATWWSPVYSRKKKLRMLWGLLPLAGMIGGLYFAIKHWR